MNYKKKIDSNQKEIVAQLRSIPGVTVSLDHDDIIVGVRGKNFWYEIKSPDSISKKTGEVLDSFKKPSQIKLENSWQGHYRIVTSINDILKEIL